jgi:hypothetical protein
MLSNVVFKTIKLALRIPPFPLAGAQTSQPHGRAPLQNIAAGDVSPTADVRRRKQVHRGQQKASHGPDRVVCAAPAVREEVSWHADWSTRGFHTTYGPLKRRAGIHSSVTNCYIRSRKTSRAGLLGNWSREFLRNLFLNGSMRQVKVTATRRSVHYPHVAIARVEN